MVMVKTPVVMRLFVSSAGIARAKHKPYAYMGWTTLSPISHGVPAYIATGIDIWAFLKGTHSREMMWSHLVRAGFTRVITVLPACENPLSKSHGEKKQLSQRLPPEMGVSHGDWHSRRYSPGDYIAVKFWLSTITLLSPHCDNDHLCLLEFA